MDAYHSLSAALIDVQDANSILTHTNRIISVINAYREWALSHSEEYGLVFGTPIQDYQAPLEIINPAAAGSLSILIQILDTAYQAGKLEINELSISLKEMLKHWINKLNYTGPPAIIHLALASWAHIHGLVSLELFGNLTASPECTDVTPLFEAEIQALLKRIGLVL